MHMDKNKEKLKQTTRHLWNISLIFYAVSVLIINVLIIINKHFGWHDFAILILLSILILILLQFKGNNNKTIIGRQKKSVKIQKNNSN